jgi:hypothetical protein
MISHRDMAHSVIRIMVESKTAKKQEPGARPGSTHLHNATRRQNETTPNSINRMMMLSGTPSNHRIIGIVAS